LRLIFEYLRNMQVVEQFSFRNRSLETETKTWHFSLQAENGFDTVRSLGKNMISSDFSTGQMSQIPCCGIYKSRVKFHVEESTRLAYTGLDG